MLNYIPLLLLNDYKFKSIFLTGKQKIKRIIFVQIFLCQDWGFEEYNDGEQADAEEGVPAPVREPATETEWIKRSPSGAFISSMSNEETEWTPRKYTELLYDDFVHVSSTVVRST